MRLYFYFLYDGLQNGRRLFFCRIRETGCIIKFAYHTIFVVKQSTTRIPRTGENDEFRRKKQSWSMTNICRLKSKHTHTHTHPRRISKIHWNYSRAFFSLTYNVKCSHSIPFYSISSCYGILITSFSGINWMVNKFRVEIFLHAIATYAVREQVKIHLMSTIPRRR